MFGLPAESVFGLRRNTQPTGCRCPGWAIRPAIWSDALRWRTAGAALNDVTQYLGCELDAATLEDDPAGFRIAGQDYVAGGRQIARVLCAHLAGHDAEWEPDA